MSAASPRAKTAVLGLDAGPWVMAQWGFRTMPNGRCAHADESAYGWFGIPAIRSSGIRAALRSAIDKWLFRIGRSDFPTVS